MFDFIDRKKQISLLYGFFFASLQDDALGMQPHLQALLSLYKFFAPTLISVSLPVRRKIYFNNSKNLWASALIAVKQRNQGAFPEPPKLILGPSKGRSLKRCSVLQSLTELLQNWLLWLSMDDHVQPVTSSPL
ncbi:centromere protein I [Cricetulus griseus]